MNLALSDEPDALPSLVVNIIEASPHATADELAKLAQLHKDGVLTDAEFAAAKQKVLFGSGKDGTDGLDGATDGLSAAALTAQILVSYDELAARLISTEIELKAIYQLDVPPPPASPPLCQMPVLSGMVLSQKAKKGAQIIKLESQACGLEKGMMLSIGEGDTQEAITIYGFGSILLAAPLQYNHAAGEAVTFLPSSPPMAPVADVAEQVLGGAGDSAISDSSGDEEAFMVTMIVC